MSELERLESELEAPIRGLLDAALPVPNNGRLLEIERAIVPERGSNKRQFLWVALLLGLSGLAAAYYFSGPGIINSDRSTEFNQSTTKTQSDKSDNKVITETYEVKDSVESPVIYRQEVIPGE